MSNLILYRRHSEDCPGFPIGREYKRCKCPVWCDGRDNAGKRVNHSMKTRDWDRAERMDPAAAPARKLLADAIREYMLDCEQLRGLGVNTVYSYRRTLAGLEAVYLDELTPDVLTGWRLARGVKPSTSAKELIHLKAFFKYCKGRKWIDEDPSAAFKPPKERSAPTLPFTQKEVEAILGACNKIRPSARARARAMVLVMLYSGLRVSDVTKLERSQLTKHPTQPGGRLFLRTAKTGMAVYSALPVPVVDALEALPKGRYFFWSGSGKLKSQVSSLQRTFVRVLEEADVEGHLHRFRDTCAVRLLEKGKSLETVADLLGNSIQIVQKHYKTWSKGQQDNLDDATGALDFLD